MKKQRIKFTVEAALIAALYAGLTFLSSVAGLAYGPIQLRFSEALCVLAMFTPAAIPGLTVGCFIANMLSFSAVDMLFGTLATLIAAFLSYRLRSVKFKGFSFFSFFPPVVVNAVFVGLEITLFLSEGAATLAGFLLNFATVCLGQILACIGLGVPLYIMISRLRHFDNFIEKS